ncbi:response regulator [Pelagicoccus sp. NFK12]|uniref:histidine kinase n=1 Tax=Pelagicoccus enzymogenes TaxID=2773457 RepID=A0A927IFN0_9BACT|nr:ATP-binding protein [Pelagicoccus enzymogenes]MBD5778276.1 response regulator [Pelagicoccus enzymogenes]
MPDDEQLEIWKRQYQREKQSRKEAEALLESKSRELYLANEELKSLTKELEKRVAERTKIIERQKNEALLQAAQLQESEKRFQDVTQAAGEYVWETDESLTLTYLSEQASDSLEYDIEDLVGFPLVSIFANQSDDDQDSINYLIELFKERKTFKGQALRCRDKSGNLKWHTISAVPKIDPHQRFRGYRGTGRDITDMQKARDEAIKAARAKSEFFSNMSHEIRTPLNGIVGMSRILLESNLREDQFNYAQSIKSSADSLVTLANSIFDISLIESGKLELKEKDFSIDELLDSCLDYIKGKADPKSIELRFAVARNVPQYAFGDAARLKQAILNLLENAVNFTNQGEVMLSVQATENDLIFEISDTGIGISDTEIEKIFKSYESSHSLSYQREGGSGLGLSISKGIAEAMGGQLTATSALKKGSTFRLSIPSKKASIEALSYPEKHCAVLSSDNRQAKRLAERLQRLGCQVIDTLEASQEWEKLSQKGDLLAFRFLPLGQNRPSEAEEKRDRALREKGASLVYLHRESEAGNEPGVAYIDRPVRTYRLLRALAPDPLPDDSAANLPFKGIRCLVIDDNSINLQVAESMLSKLGALVEVTTSASACIQKLKHSSFEVILMDIRMPSVNGVEATRMIRSNGIATPIIAVTANAGEGEIDTFFQAGMNGYIPKPLLSSELEAEVSRCLKLKQKTQTPATTAAHGKTSNVFDELELLSLFSHNFELSKLVVSEFSKQTKCLMEELTQLVKADNPTSTRECLHNLSGSSFNLRANAFGESCAKLSKLIGNEASEQVVDAQLKTLHEDYATLRARLEAFLNT